MSEPRGLARLADGLSDAERALLRERLWALLSRQVARATQGDSTSLPVERAEELFASLCHTLRLWLDENGLPPQALLRGDADEALRGGWALLERQAALARDEYAEAVAAAPPYANRALRDTLRGIAPFFRRYDVRLAAHQLPAEIDYPLCRPVPETMLGVAYLREYLRRLRIESALLSRFAPARVEALLAAYYADPEGLLVNLCEPVAACAVGLTLCGGDALALRFSATQRARLADCLAGQTPAALAERLRAAAEQVAARLRLPAPDARYLAELAVALAPRIPPALAAGSLHGVFACGADG